MRILHTSDWHLGQHFMMKSREAEHLAFLNWLIEIVDRESIDVVMVAGDIFDTASPASYARKLYSDFIVKLQKVNCAHLVIVSGNHDSVAVLNESKSLLKALNVSVLAGLSEDLTDHMITVSDKHNNEAIICALPFLRATDVMMSESGSSAAQKQMSLQQGIAQTYQDIYQLANAQKTEDKTPLLATGHLTAVGCSVSESVRDIYIGTLTAFPAQLFPQFDYIALGHLHRSQKVQKSEHIRYSGSPLALSFDESNHEKSVIIVEFNAQRELTTSEVVIPNFQKLQVIKGDMEAIQGVLTTLIESAESVWVEVKVQESFYRSDVQALLNTFVEGSAVEILKISMPKIDEHSQWQTEQIETLDALKPQDLFQYRLECADAEYISEAQQKHLKLLFAQSVEELEQQS
ncbi:exonuclease subunit SbcD [Psychromonas sp. Urea-02u-13]|uniref:exonuclease subunit SbcD n=1 Tax=Psychromonas sp. Urea-02u-13 TaxID=2058326 RepID=UPI000C31E110|nr:exonuclease subunit SbcD [Psychromonas sp. Urea-02u-13]PKG38380.1 exonuclease subunit SbcD [Psychromonas sp. Urea-02u-13]